MNTLVCQPRKHHYVPVMLLRSFTDEQGQLYAFDRRRADIGIYPTNPVDAFAKRDLNTFEETDGTKDWSLEKSYAEFESEVAPILDRIIESARAHRKPQLTDKELNIWFNFVYHQQKRAPDAFDRTGVTANFQSDVLLSAAKIEDNGRQLTQEEWDALGDPKTLKRIKQRALVVARSRGCQEIVEALGNRGLMIGVAKHRNKSFIIGDHPIVRMGPPNRKHLADSLVELWFPIAHDVAISPWGLAGHEQLTELDSEHVRYLNRVVFNNCNLVAARSDRLIRSLAGLK